ncbi:MAG: 50S ribosomal protein L11 methyltransferase [Ginsengibacter sp.]
MNQYVSVTIQPLETSEAEILMANLSDLSFYAFEQTQNQLIAYCKSEDFDEIEMNKFIPSSAGFTKEIIEDKNWNAQWESDFQPVVVDDFVAIRASFHSPISTVKHDIVITPKMSFGTGHHATTYLMIAQMEGLNFENKTVLDFGTGTGVLAILAEKLGAAKVLAIDYDEWSIHNSIENIEANQCKNIKVEQSDTLGKMEPVDLILANINLNVLSAASQQLADCIKANGFLLISGFLDTDEEEINQLFTEVGMTKRKTMQKEKWLCILFQKNNAQ